MGSKSGIYCITNTINHKCYVGSSKNANGRVGQHFRWLKYGTHHNPHLQASYNKYGRDVFVCSILLFCEEFELLKYEQYFIDTLKPEYNKNPIAGRSAGVRRSQSTRDKLRELAQNRSIETRKRISLSNTGKHQSEESRKKKSDTLKGRIFSQETKAKITAALTGVKHSPERIEINRLSQLGKHLSPETIEKIRKANIGKHRSQETKDRISKSHKGIKFTPEHCLHISEAKKNVKPA